MPYTKEKESVHLPFVILHFLDTMSYTDTSSLFGTASSSSVAASNIVFTNIMYIPMLASSFGDNDEGFDKCRRKPSCTAAFNDSRSRSFVADFSSSGPFSLFPSPDEELEEGEWSDVEAEMKFKHGLRFTATQRGHTVATVSNDGDYFTIFVARLGCLEGSVTVRSCRNGGRGGLVQGLGLTVSDTRENPSIRLCVSLFKIPTKHLALPMNFDLAASRTEQWEALLNKVRSYSDTADDDDDGLPQLPRWLRALIRNAPTDDVDSKVSDGFRVLSYVVLKHSCRCLAPNKILQEEPFTLCLPAISCRSVIRPHITAQRLAGSIKNPTDAIKKRQTFVRVSLGLKKAKCIKWGDLECLETVGEVQFQVSKQFLPLDESLTEDEANVLMEALEEHMAPVVVVVRVSEHLRPSVDELLSTLMLICQSTRERTKSSARSTVSLVSRCSVPEAPLRRSRDGESAPPDAPRVETAGLPPPRGTPMLLTAEEADEVMNKNFRRIMKRRPNDKVAGQSAAPSPTVAILAEMNRRVEFFSPELRLQPPTAQSASLASLTTTRKRPRFDDSPLHDSKSAPLQPVRAHDQIFTRKPREELLEAYLGQPGQEHERWPTQSCHRGQRYCASCDVRRAHINSCANKIFDLVHEMCECAHSYRESCS